MKKTFLAGVFALFLWAGSAGLASADFFTIQNAGFDSFSGWGMTGVAGVFDINSTHIYSDPYPDGNAGYINGGSIYQILTDTYQADTNYTLKFVTGWVPSYEAAPIFDFALMSGGTPLAIQSASGLIKDQWVEQSLVLSSADIPGSAMGQAIEIWFLTGALNQRQVNLDNVSLEAVASVPIPSAIALLAFGLVALAGLNRRN